MSYVLVALALLITAPDAMRHRTYYPQVIEARQWLREQYHDKHGNYRQWRCLDKLWENESHWRVKARNPVSGAFGIPQALPGRKMRSVGSDWKVSAMTQVMWGRRYIKARYGQPCQALRFQRQHGWY